MINQKEKAEKAYIRYIKSLKSKCSVNNPVSYFDLPVWEVWCKGSYNSAKSYFARLEIDRDLYTVEPCQKNDDYNFNTDLLNIAKQLATQLKATLIVKTIHEPTDSWYVKPIARQFAEAIEFKAKPVSEFNKLINWLNRKGLTTPIGEWDTYVINLFGKRGYYDESGQKQYLAHSSKRCEQLLNELKSTYHFGDKLVLSKIKQEDDIDTRESIEYETECYGMRYYYYELSIYTKGGKLRKIIRLI